MVSQTGKTENHQERLLHPPSSGRITPVVILSRICQIVVDVASEEKSSLPECKTIHVHAMCKVTEGLRTAIQGEKLLSITVISD